MAKRKLIDVITDRKENPFVIIYHDKEENSININQFDNFYHAVAYFTKMNAYKCCGKELFYFPANDTDNVYASFEEERVVLLKESNYDCQTIYGSTYATIPVDHLYIPENVNINVIVNKILVNTISAIA